MSSELKVGLVAEAVLVFVGVLGVAGMFQDYYQFRLPELVTLEAVWLKYYGALLGAVLYAVTRWVRQRKSSKDF